MIRVDQVPKCGKRAAIIGSGVVGVTTAKCCLEEGIDIVVYEKSSYTGGLWRYHSGENEDGAATVMHSTVINSNKEVSAFSDFPPDETWSNFVHNSKMVCNNCNNNNNNFYKRDGAKTPSASCKKRRKAVEVKLKLI